MKPGMLKIFNALTHAEALSFTELKRKTGLSNPVLSDYLHRFCEQGIVVRDPKTRKYMLAQIYFPSKLFPNEYQKTLKLFAVGSIHMALKITKIKNEELRKKAFKGFLRHSFHFLAVLAWKIIGEAVGALGADNTQKQDLIAKMGAAINQAYRNWVIPLANVLAVAIAINSDIIDVADKYFAEEIERGKAELREIADLLKVASADQ